MGETYKTAVIGLGGSANNAINNLIDRGILNCEFIAIDCDKEALALSKATQTFCIASSTHAPSSSAINKPGIAAALAAEFSVNFASILDDFNNIIFIAGLGGATGSGTLPVFASLALDNKLKVNCIVIMPFGFEGNHRKQNAENAIAELSAQDIHVKVFDNQSLFKRCDEKTTFAQAFRIADNEIHKIILELLDEHNFSKADVKSLNFHVDC